MTNEELNKAMAERVMGWYLTEKKVRQGWDYWANKDYQSQCVVKDWNPATDANDALRVAGIMTSKGWVLMADTLNKTVSFWRRTDMPSVREYYYAVFETVTDIPRAICEAAAKAVGDG